jgi:hypothetical protein
MSKVQIDQTEIDRLEMGLFDEFRCWDGDGVFDIEQGCTWQVDDNFVSRNCRVEGPSLEAVEDMFFSLSIGEGELREADGEQHVFWPVSPERGFVFVGENEDGSYRGQLRGFCWFL